MAKGEILVYKRLNDPDRPIFSERRFKYPILVMLFGWFANIILDERLIDQQPEVYSWSSTTHGKPNQIAGEVNVVLWEEYVRVYNNFRTLEKEVNLDIKTNERLKGKVIAHDTLKGNIYDKTQLELNPETPSTETPTESS